MTDLAPDMDKFTPKPDLPPPPLFPPPEPFPPPAAPPSHLFGSCEVQRWPPVSFCQPALFPPGDILLDPLGAIDLTSASLSACLHHSFCALWTAL